MADDDLDFTAAENSDSGGGGKSGGGGGGAAGGNKLMLIIIGVNLAVTGIIATKVMTAKPPTIVTQPPIVEAEEDEGTEESDDESLPGPIRPLEPLIVNLNETEGSRFLKIQMDIEVEDAETLLLLGKDKISPGPRFRAVKDELLTYLSSLKVSDTMGEDNKRKIKAELKVRLEKILGEETVKRVYFGQFVVQ